MSYKSTWQTFFNSEPEAVGIMQATPRKKRVVYQIEPGTAALERLLPEQLDAQTVYSLLSAAGGFASINFVEWIRNRDKVRELTAATLTVGKKQIEYLDRLGIEKATFIIAPLFRRRGTAEEYGYFGTFKDICLKNNWKIVETSNHSKVILCDTARGRYVLETSSNLNENPKIEQFSFCKDDVLYNFYYNFYHGLLKNK